MKIGYKKSKLNFDIILGLLFIGLGIRKVYLGSTDMMIYLIFAIGIGYTAYTIFKFLHPYLILSETDITCDGIPKKSIRISEITESTEYTRGYIIKSGKTTLRINKSLIDKNDLETFQNFYNEKLKL